MGALSFDGAYGQDIRGVPENRRGHDSSYDASGIVKGSFGSANPARRLVCQPARRLVCQLARRLVCQPARRLVCQTWQNRQADLPRGKNSRRTDLPREKKFEKPKCVSNDRSRRDDSNSPRIVKIGAILGYFWPCQSLRRKPTSLSATLGRA